MRIPESKNIRLWQVRKSNLEKLSLYSHFRTFDFSGLYQHIYINAGRFVLRLPKTTRINKNFDPKLYKWAKAINEHGKRNFGQPVYNLVNKKSLKPVLFLCKKVNGIPTNDLVELPLTKKQIINAQKTAIAKMKIIASAPLKSFYKLIDDLNHLTHTNFTIDPSEGSLLIGPETKNFI